jgi:hypothetical protein
MSWFQLAQYRFQYKALVNTVMKLQFHEVRRIVSNRENVSQEGFCSVELLDL